MSQNVNANPEHEPVRIDHSPTKTSTYAAIGAAIIAGATSAPFSLLSLPLGIAGIGALAAGLLVMESRKWVTLGTGALFLSVLVSGGFGTPVEFLLVSAVATILAWDLGGNAIDLGEQIGRHSRTRRNEVIHGAVSTLVGIAAILLGYAVYLIAGGGQPIAAVSMFLVAIVFFIWAIRT